VIILHAIDAGPVFSFNLIPYHIGQGYLFTLSHVRGPLSLMQGHGDKDDDYEQTKVSHRKQRCMMMAIVSKAIKMQIILTRQAWTFLLLDLVSNNCNDGGRCPCVYILPAAAMKMQ
jgi:hypothetical protein